MGGRQYYARAMDSEGEDQRITSMLGSCGPCLVDSEHLAWDSLKNQEGYM